MRTTAVTSHFGRLSWRPLSFQSTCVMAAIGTKRRSRRRTILSPIGATTDKGWHWAPIARQRMTQSRHRCVPRAHCRCGARFVNSRSISSTRSCVVYQGRSICFSQSNPNRPFPRISLTCPASGIPSSTVCGVSFDVIGTFMFS